MLMYGGSGVQVLPRFQDKFQAYFNEPKNTIEDPIQENTEIPGKMLHNQYDCTSFEQQVYLKLGYSEKATKFEKSST